MFCLVCLTNARPQRMNCQSMKFYEQFQILQVKMKYVNINSLLAYTVYGTPSKSCWLENSTIYEVLSSFAAFLGEERNFVMNPDASHGLIQNLLYPEKGVGDTVWAYERFLTIGKRAYKNMFSSNDMCVHIAVNEPEQIHWNFVLVLVKERTIIVHDPMYNQT